jgi:hypothetical protein
LNWLLLRPFLNVKVRAIRVKPSIPNVRFQALFLPGTMFVDIKQEISNCAYFASELFVIITHTFQRVLVDHPGILVLGRDSKRSRLLPRKLLTWTPHGLNVFPTTRLDP